MRDFTGQTIITTGAGPGIGRAAAVLLATERRGWPWSTSTNKA